MLLILLSCTSTKTIDSAVEVDDSSMQDTSVEEFVRPSSLQGQYIDTIRYPKAVCNDGSTPLLYIRPGIDEGQNKWVIWFEGGGVCESQEACFQRWQQEKQQMSTCLGTDCTDYQAPMEVDKYGILSDDMTENPDMYTWNHVMFHYCSSDAWLGNRNDSISSGNVALWLRGHFIAEAMFSTLLSPAGQDRYQSLSDAEEIVLAGSSSGAIGLRAHLDLFVERIPNARVVGVSDAGMVPVVFPEGMALEEAILQQTNQLWNAFSDQSCVSNHPQNVHYCQQGAFLLSEQEITTPVLYHQDQADAQGYDLQQRALGRGLSAEEQSTVHSHIRTLFQDNHGNGYIPREGNSGILTNAEFAAQSSFAEGSFAEVLGFWYQGQDILLMTP